MPAPEYTANMAPCRYLLAPSDDELLNPEDLYVWHKVNGLTRQIGDLVRNKYWEFIREHPLPNDSLQESFENFLTALRLDGPEFTLKYRNEALAWIQEYGFGDENDDVEETIKSLVAKYNGNQDDIRILIFQLPQHVARSWDDYSSDHDKLVANYDDEMRNYINTWLDALPWAYFYRSVMPEIWKILDKVKSRSEYGISLDRLNGTAQHEPDKYYYVWQVVPPRLSEHYLAKTERIKEANRQYLIDHPRAKADA